MKTKKHRCNLCGTEQKQGAICTGCGMNDPESIGPPIPDCGHEVLWRGQSFISMGQTDKYGALSISNATQPLEHIAYITDWRLPK